MEQNTLPNSLPNQWHFALPKSNDSGNVHNSSDTKTTSTTALTLTISTDYRYTAMQLDLGGQTLLEKSKLRAWTQKIKRGTLKLHFEQNKGKRVTPRLFLNGKRLAETAKVRVPPSSHVWTHAALAFLASGAGFFASYLYLEQSQAFDQAWSLKMGQHMAGWHLLLCVLLFPASIWGQTIGIAMVVGTCFVFFLIHLGIAISNAIDPYPWIIAQVDLAFWLKSIGGWIGFWNGISGLFFLLAAVEGIRAYKQMKRLWHAAL